MRLHGKEKRAVIDKITCLDRALYGSCEIDSLFSDKEELTIFKILSDGFAPWQKERLFEARTIALYLFVSPLAPASQTVSMIDRVFGAAHEDAEFTAVCHVERSHAHQKRIEAIVLLPSTQRA
jgi:hypothetical protein